MLEDNYENLVVKSSGLYRFKSPGSFTVSRLDVRLFGCVSNFALWFVLDFVISSRMVGICRSVCRSLFGTYHGALTIVLRALFWKRCKISMFEREAVPQIGKPYFHIGFSIDCVVGFCSLEIALKIIRVKMVFCKIIRVKMDFYIHVQ
jgi:hypothetical protein